MGWIFETDGWQNIVMSGRVHESGLYFWRGNVVVCGRHCRGILLQPVTSYDLEKGYGAAGCPFCAGGKLAGTYAQYKSKKQLSQVLDKLSEEGEAGNG